MNDVEVVHWDNADPEHVAAQLREGKLSAKQIASAINIIAKAEFSSALPQVEAALDSDDPVVRISALNALSFTFASDRRFEKILEMFQTDADEDVRCSAATTLGLLSRRGAHSEIPGILAVVIKNNAESDYVRTSAFEAFMDALGIPSRDREPVAAGDLSTINWALLS